MWYLRFFPLIKPGPQLFLGLRAEHPAQAEQAAARNRAGWGLPADPGTRCVHYTHVKKLRLRREHTAFISFLEAEEEGREAAAG